MHLINESKTCSLIACLHACTTQSFVPRSEVSWWPAAADKLERRAAAVRLQVAFTGALAGSLLSVTAFVEEALHCYRCWSSVVTLVALHCAVRQRSYSAPQCS